MLLRSCALALLRSWLRPGRPSPRPGLLCAANVKRFSRGVALPASAHPVRASRIHILIGIGGYGAINKMHILAGLNEVCWDMHGSVTPL